MEVLDTTQAETLLDDDAILARMTELIARHYDVPADLRALNWRQLDLCDMALAGSRVARELVTHAVRTGAVHRAARGLAC